VFVCLFVCLFVWGIGMCMLPRLPIVICQHTQIIWSALFLIITVQNLRNDSRQSPLTICSKDYSRTDICMRPKLSFSIKWLITKMRSHCSSSSLWCSNSS
jgi:hypothetical protein